MREIKRYLISLVLLLILWWIASAAVQSFSSGAKSSILPDPLVAFEAIRASWDKLTHHFFVSAYRLSAGLSVAALLGSSIGLWVGFEKNVDDLISPIIYLLYPIPKVVFLPVVLILLGLSDFSRIFFVFLVVVFQILISARDAAKNIPEDPVLAVKSAGATRAQLYRHVVLPATLPGILASLRVSVGIGVASLYLAETSYANRGLGYYVSSTWKVFAYPDVFAGIVALALLGLILYLAIDVLERVLCRWRFE
ncbi:MAG: ABC transporter permease [Candidatus Bipolaricaulota bacterium]